MKLLNGRVYSGNYSIFVLIYNDGKYAMLHIDRHAIKGMSCPMFQNGNNHQAFHTEKELKEKFDSDSWEMLDGRLRIEKIDDMSFVDYPNGKLNVISSGA